MFCIAVSLVILVTVVFSDDDTENEETVGVVFDIKETKNGYTFIFEDHDSKRTKCFFRTMPKEGVVYVMNGTMSDDNTILFVSSMTSLHSE